MFEEDIKIRDEEFFVNLDVICCDKIEYMVCIKKLIILYELFFEVLLFLDIFLGLEEFVFMDLLLLEDILGELIEGKGSSEFDEFWELDDSYEF